MSRPKPVSLPSAISEVRSAVRVREARPGGSTHPGRRTSAFVRSPTEVSPGAQIGAEAHVSSHGADFRPEVAPMSLPASVPGEMVHVAEVARDIVEVVIRPARRIGVHAGQYCYFQFEGYPARSFSPTSALGRIADDGYVRLNIKRVREGQVTSHLGRSIKVGHAVAIEGPYGSAPLQGREAGRLVLVGSGTGFAPVWAVAAAALRAQSSRPIVLIAASERLDAFYMAPALGLASTYPNVVTVAAVRELSAPWHGFVPGGPLEYLPAIAAGDMVYAAGSSALVATFRDLAAAAGAAFHADPFEPASPPRMGWLEAARGWLKAG